MRSRTPDDLRGRCPRCFLPHRLCLCDALPRLAVDTRFVIVRHAKQAWKTSNTARLAALALPHGTLVDYGLPDGDFDDAVLRQPGAVLLFPDAPPACPAPPPSCVVVVDGSWSQARRMTQRLAVLRTMPRWALPAPLAGSERLRKPPHREGMSTLEAIAHAVAQLEGEAAARPLFWLHAEHMRRVRISRGEAPRDAARPFPG